jgi:hypothetical protein
MVSHLFYYQLALVALVWLFVMLHGAESHRGAPIPPTATPLKPKSKRSNAPKPFNGLTKKPHCALCERDTSHPKVPPPLPPDPMAPTNRRPREVDTSRHFCPHSDCDYRGWLGLGNINANGLPTICQPRFVNFLPHLHDWLTTTAAGIIAGAMTQYGHKNTQQSVANIA